MSTLDTHGMVTRFKLNRELNGAELEHHMKVRQEQSENPHYELSLIRFNSTFAESVDKWYAMRGFVGMGGVILTVLLIAFCTFGIYAGSVSHDATFFLLAMFPGALLGVSIYLSAREFFTHTHYPIRFNRKNRQVYVLQRDGTVLKAAWDSIYWTIFGHGVGFGDIYVMGHVMSDDRKIVKQSFALSCVSAGRQGIDELKGHFEFYRRYMEQGPEDVLKALDGQPLVMLPPLHRRKESWAFGWQRLTLNINGFLLAQIIFQVFFLPMSFFRWIAMRTSKIPQWPQWVENECLIEADDPWVREGK